MARTSLAFESLVAIYAIPFSASLVTASPLELESPTVFSRQNQFILALLIVLDLTVLLGSWNLAYWLRFSVGNG